MTQITRRAVLAGGLSVPLLAGLSSRVAFSAPARLPTLAVLTGIGPRTLPGTIEAAVTPFLKAGIALSLNIRPHDADGACLDDAMALKDTLRNLHNQHPALIELGIHFEGPVPSDPYFQLRLASAAQAEFGCALNLVKDKRQQQVLMAASATTTAPIAGPQDWSAARAAGLRTVIHVPSRAAPAPATKPFDGSGYWFTKTGLVNTNALSATSATNTGTENILRAPEDVAAGLRDALTAAAPLILHFDIEALSPLAQADMLAYLSQLAALIAQARDRGAIATLLPHRLYQNSRKGAQRYVIPRVDDLRVSQTGLQAHEAFTADLKNRGIAFSEAIIPHGYGDGLLTPLASDAAVKPYMTAMLADAGYDAATHGLEHSHNELLGQNYARALELMTVGIGELAQTTGKVPVGYVAPNNAYDSVTLDALAASGVRLFSGQNGQYDWLWGLDHRGLLVINNTVSFEKSWQGEIDYFETGDVLAHVGETNDAVLMLHPNTVSTPEKKRRIFDALAALEAEPGTALVNFSQYYGAVMPQMPNFQQATAARAQVMVRDPITAPDVSMLERKLKEDAATAWQYFDTLTRHHDGLVSATAWFYGDQLEGHPFLTLWDVGSHLMACLAAHRLGIIDQKRFEPLVVRMLGVLENTPPYRFKEARLPVIEIPVEKTKSSLVGFDSADCARLLLCLRILDRHTNGALPIKRLIDGWQLAETLPQGRMHDVANGRLVSLHTNSYSSYAIRGFTEWGFDVAPVFDIPVPGNDMDLTMQFMEELARRGRIATEPHTTAEIEFGDTGYSKQIADLVHQAHVDRFEKTGILTCASEGPLDREPWFTYQGYQIDHNGGEFVVDATVSDRRYLTKKFADATRFVSAKGAFLWLATRPGGYSERLHEAVRGKCKSDRLGFTAGIYEKSKRSVDVADVNTNGIILEAISYILNGRKPLLD